MEAGKSYRKNQEKPSGLAKMNLTENPRPLLPNPDKARKIDFQERMRLLGQNRWQLDPTAETSPRFEWENYNDYGYVETDFVDLHPLPAGSELFFTGKHINASYWSVKILEKNVIKLWRDRGGQSSGLVGGIDYLFICDGNSQIPNSTEQNVYTGMLAAAGNCGYRVRIALPYFNYDAQKKVLLPKETDIWFDEIKRLFLKKA